MPQGERCKFSLFFLRCSVLPFISLPNSLSTSNLSLRLFRHSFLHSFRPSSFSIHGSRTSLPVSSCFPPSFHTSCVSLRFWFSGVVFCFYGHQQTIVWVCLSVAVGDNLHLWFGHRFLNLQGFRLEGGGWQKITENQWSRGRQNIWINANCSSSSLWCYRLAVRP